MPDIGILHRVKRSLSDSLKIVLVLAAVSLLLGLLVTLQLRWTGEISRRQRADLHARLIEKSSSFARDFDLEVTRLFFSFGLEYPETAQRDSARLEQEIARQYLEWEKHAPFPEILGDIWLMRERDGPPWRFNAASGRFEAAPRLFEHGDLPGRIAGQLGKNLTAQENRVRLLSLEPLGFVTAWRSLSGRSQRSTEPRVLSLTCLIVEVDLRALRERLVAEIARRHFYREGEPEFDFGIVDSGPGEVVLSGFSSEGPPRPQQFDAAVGLWRLEPRELLFPAWAPAAPPPPPPPPVPPPPGGDSGQAGGSRVSGSSPDASVERERGQRAGTSAAGGRLVALGLETDSGPFLLLTRYRAGKLDSIVAGERIRNLSWSLGATLLLAIATILLFWTAIRERRFSARQREWVAGVSHELRTPLSVIAAAGENLADGVIPPDDASLREYGELLKSETRHLGAQLEDLIEFAAISSGRRRYSRAEVDPVGLVRMALDRSRFMIRESGMAVDVELPDCAPAVPGDEEALSRMLQNLISNALKYGREGGWIGVELKELREKGEIQISVRDRGVGIPRRDLHRIFLPFERGSGAVRKRVGGAGVGLSLVKQIVEQHGGRVEVESESGRGACFRVFLPVVGSPRSIDPRREPAVHSAISRFQRIDGDKDLGKTGPGKDRSS